MQKYISLLLVLVFVFSSVGIIHAQTPAPPVPQCECKGWSGKPVKISSPVITTYAKCGGGVKLKKGSYALTSPVYFCFPAGCLPTYYWNISGPVSGSNTGQTFGFTFSVVGTYTVTITPVCGTRKCPPCIFKVVVV